MSEGRVSTEFLLFFAPEQWTAVSKFRLFMGPPFEVSRELSKGANTADNHLAKFNVLAGLARRLKEQLAEDEAELAEKGHSSARRSKEFAALVEALFCELYAALDGVRRTIYATHRKVKGVQNKSTEALFQRANECKYGPGFPEDVRTALAAAFGSWFPRLRLIRTEVTHGDIGSCHIDGQTRKVVYTHRGLGSATRCLVIEDVIAELNQQAAFVLDLIETIFQALLSRLLPVERKVVCGFYKGRIYEREVANAPELSFASGRCISHTWFGKATAFECPMRHTCGAYERAVPGKPSSPEQRSR